MTEQEWLACDDSDQMIYVVEQSGSARKLRLFTLHVCLRLSTFLGTDEMLPAFAIGEQVADGHLPVSCIESHSQRFGGKAMPIWDNVHYDNGVVVPESYQPAYQAHALTAFSLALQPLQARQYEQTPNGNSISIWPVDGVVFNALRAV